MLPDLINNKKWIFMRKLLHLFLMFFKIGLFTFGGGYAMLPLLQAEIVKKRRWATDEELLDLYSIGQCTPGIISVNVATFMGYRQAGIAGACAATLGMVMPSLIIITLLAAVLDRYMHNRYVSYAFTGIRICVVALILDIIYDLWKKGITDYKGAGENWRGCVCTCVPVCVYVSFSELCKNCSRER